MPRYRINIRAILRENAKLKLELRKLEYALHQASMRARQQEMLYKASNTCCCEMETFVESLHGDVIKLYDTMVKEKQQIVSFRRCNN